MARKTLVLSLMMIGVAGGLALLSADEPTAPAPADKEAKLLQRIEQLERRVEDLERQLAAQQGLQFTAEPPAPLQAPEQTDPSLWMRNLPRHEINGQPFYIVPLKR